MPFSFFFLPPCPLLFPSTAAFFLLQIPLLVLAAAVFFVHPTDRLPLRPYHPHVTSPLLHRPLRRCCLYTRALVASWSRRRPHLLWRSPPLPLLAPTFVFLQPNSLRLLTAPLFLFRPS
jgi:hypothetical protein